MSIYTRTGDDGTTASFGGKRTRKDSPQIEVCGTVDELTSLLGLVLTNQIEETDRRLISQIQQDLYQIMGSVSGADLALAFIRERVVTFEHTIDSISQKVPSLNEFILPQGTLLSVYFHIARTVCRRAERRLVSYFYSNKSLPPAQHSKIIITYINRLSDLLFAFSRKYNMPDKEISVSS